MIANSLLMGLLILTGHLEWAERLALDKLFELRGVRQPGATIVLVAIDQRTLDDLGQAWPLPRALHAQLITKLNAAAPLAIGIDLVFSTPSPRGSADDLALSGSLRNAGNVVLASGMVRDVGDPGGRLRQVRPLPEFSSVVAAVGPATLELDPDGVVRKTVIREEVEGESISSFAAHVARLARKGPVGIHRPEEIATRLINYRGGPRTYPWIPYHQVIRDQVPEEMVRGKIVLVGSTDSLEHDFFATPFASRPEMPGLEVHANIVENVLRGNFVREVSAILGLIVAMGMAALVTAVVLLPHAWAVAAWGLIVLVTGVGTFALFALGDIWFHSIGALLGAVLGFGCAMTLKARECAGHHSLVQK